MVAITNILFMAVAAAASVLPRDAATIQNDLNTINSNTVDLTNKANSYNGGVFNAQPVQNAYTTVDNAVKNATTDANNSAAVSAADSQKIIDYINNTLEPNIAKAVKAITDKKAKYTADGLKSTVHDDFVTLKSDTDKFATALLAKAPSSVQSNGQAAQKKIDADLQSGIDAFA